MAILFVAFARGMFVNTDRHVEEVEEIEGEETLNNKCDDAIYPLKLNDIRIDKDRMSLFEIKRRYEKDDIVLDPDFQRNQVWGRRQESEYDRYMLGDGNKESFQQFCNEILSINKLGIKIIYIHSDNDGCKEMGKYIKEKHPNLEWTTQHPTQEQQKNYAHDRYLIIDNKIEIIFTSGICHLMNNSKDFTYIVRRHKQ